MGDFSNFCDHWVWIEDKERHCAIRLELWPAQRGVCPGLVADMLLILLKTRQVGLTWLCAALVLWLGIKNLLHLTVIISASEDHAIEFLDRVYFILDRLPDWMVPTVKTRTRQCLEFISEDGLTSTIKSMPTIEMGAESKTPNLLIIDEAHMIRNVGQIFGASLPGIEQAKGRVIVIANSIKNAPGWGWIRDTYTASMKGLNKFKRIFLPWMAHPGRPADFCERMIESGMDKQEVKEHYPCSEAEALEAAAGGYFGETLLRHKDFMPGVRGYLRFMKNSKVVEFIEDKRGPVIIWRYPYDLVADWDGSYWVKRYAVGSDVSEGLGETSSTGYVMDRMRDELVAKVKSNRVDAVEWAKLLYMLSLYYGDSVDRTQGEAFKVQRIPTLVCPELTGSGQTTVKEMLKLRANLYVRVVPDHVGSGLTKQYGWPESQGAKWELAGGLKEWFKTTKGRIFDADLIDQASIFIKHENGKLGHEEGKEKYDDDVIGAGLTVQASQFLGEGPQLIKPPLTGWRGREAEQAKKGEAWAA